MQYFRRIAFVSKSATLHQDLREGSLEPAKNSRADSLARKDSPPTRHRLLQVPDGRRNHGRPQTLIATPLLRRRPLREGFEPAKNSRADSLARKDSPPTRVGFFKSRTADAITAAPRR